MDIESRQSVLGNDDARPGGSSTSIFCKSQKPVSVKFENVVYKIETKRKVPRDEQAGKKSKTPIQRLLQRSNKDLEKKVILKGVSGAVLPGEMLAMLGPSGSGKTTLLTALGGRLGGDLSGTITYNGRPFSNSMKRNMGFVTQDDVLYPHLTVGETLYFTALLRLPREMTRQEKAQQSESVMAQLGLSHCRDSIIGGAMVRGVSGGERKRVSIGQEMLINPSLLFLDEPTSGLDSTTAQRIVSTLWELANGGRTVVMTIHQPSSRLFYMFHKILLISDGNPIYFGNGSQAIDYFASIGHSPSVAMNPSDFLLDLANGVTTSDDPPEYRTALKRELVSAYGNHIRPKLEVDLQEADSVQPHPSGAGSTGPAARTDRDGHWSTSWWDQFRVLLQRDLKERRHEAFSALRIAQVLVTATLAGFLWWQSGAHIADQVGLLFFTTGFWGFTPLFQAIFTFPQERTMLAKERSSGMYRLSSYFAARMAGDLPMELALPALFVIITYWMGGLKPAAASFFATLFTTLLSVLVSSGLGLAIGALIMNLKTATTMGSVIMLTFLLVGGFYVQKVPRFISWIKYLSISYYTFKLGLLSQFSPGETYLCPGAESRCYVEDIPAVAVVGLHNRGWAIGAMFFMLVFYRLVAYLGLTKVGVIRHR